MFLVPQDQNNKQYDAVNETNPHREDFMDDGQLHLTLIGSTVPDMF